MFSRIAVLEGPYRLGANASETWMNREQNLQALPLLMICMNCI